MGAMRQQNTLATPAEFAGVGLHCGETCRIIVNPAPVHTGIVFRRADLRLNGDGDRHSVLIYASPENVASSEHGTTLSNMDGATVSTIEHLMAALAILSIDNATVEVYGPEIPILDGSARPLVEGLQKAGITVQQELVDEIIITKSIRVENGDSIIEIEPSDRRTIDIKIDFGNCLIGQQSLFLDLDDEETRSRMVGSRTFCRLYEVDALREAGLIRGGSLENSLVVDGASLLNDQPLRDPQEFVLHKALDLVGDLFLLGHPIRGAIRAERPGHTINTRAARAIAQSQRRRPEDVSQPAVLLQYSSV